MRGQKLNRTPEKSFTLRQEYLKDSPYFSPNTSWNPKKKEYKFFLDATHKRTKMQYNNEVLQTYVHGNWNIRGHKLKSIIKDDWKSNTPQAIGSIHFNLRRKSVAYSPSPPAKAHTRASSADPNALEDLGCFDYITYTFQSPQRAGTSSAKRRKVYHRIFTPTSHITCIPYLPDPGTKSLGLQT
ncbi:unnamed protein product [Blepharisma stoltei]|uniref:Uncharacterized protein n=1 Tax=Blepharisma stoltei TaxID=1481888 RepID=A0AAU9JT05_9CILI|nr:unnamed protein product [Blepharisma stoltei]